METLPGVPQDIDGISYYIYDEEDTKEMVNRIFYGIGLEEDTEQIGDSKEYNIEVANGGYTQGLAGRVSEKLKSDGYTVTEISTYTGGKEEHTRIIIKEAGIGQDLKDYFVDAKIEMDDGSLPDGIDIKIIIGTEQTNI